MILVLVAGNPARPNRVVAEVARQVRQAGHDVLIASIPSVSVVFDNTGQVKVHHPDGGLMSPTVVFHWLGGRHARSTLDVLEHADYRLVNPLASWRIGRNKAMQLAVFELTRIPHPWSLFTYRGWPGVEGQVPWDGGPYVLKPHDGGRGNSVLRASDGREAQQLLVNTGRFRRGVLLQEYLDHSPKPRHHYRINVVGGQPVRGGRLYSTEGTWVTNQARGGYWEPSEEFVDIPSEVVDLALRAVAAIGADYSGVDVIEGQNGQFYVLETNELPGFGEESASALGIYIAELATRLESAVTEGEAEEDQPDEEAATDREVAGEPPVPDSPLKRGFDFFSRLMGSDQ